jgi:hypothetical protein
LHVIDTDHRIACTPDGFAIAPDREKIGVVQAKVISRSVFREKWLDDPSDDIRFGAATPAEPMSFWAVAQTMTDRDEAVRIVAEHGLTPACDLDPARTQALAHGRPISVETMTRASHRSKLRALLHHIRIVLRTNFFSLRRTAPPPSFAPSASGLAFRSAPVAWDYIGRMPLEVGCIEGGGWLAADINVTHGTVGLAVLNQKGDDFLASAAAASEDEAQTVFLRLDSFASAADLVLQNWDENSYAEGTLKSVRIAAENGPTPPSCAQR